GARVYGVGALQFYNNVGFEEISDKPKEENVVATPSARESRLLEARRLLKEKDGADYKLVIIGDKAKASMQQYYSKQGFIIYNKFKSVVSYKTSLLPMFTLDTIVGFIIYNKFKSVVSYKTSLLPMFTLDTIVVCFCS
ncbi:unnamed protein product, partial [Gongylonema pulchrum]|uniref:N-acetyltransferase domain-containing protein n=1 Tax=Gongylonema pulchrum TaxID=637853 RepID=A0A183EE46_9BILA